MSTAKRVRWDCPNGEHPGVLGPRQPRADAVVRYCLDCSADAGRLVKRVAPALERKREASATRTQERQRAKREAVREERRRRWVVEVREADGSVGELDVVATAAKMMRLPTLRGAARKPRAPRITLHRSERPGHSGHAKVWGYAVHLTIGPEPDRVSVEELLLHEIVHTQMPDAEHHGARFKRTLVLAAREWWPGLTVRADSHRRAYGLDSLIRAEARKLTAS